ncbi:ATP synthase subunit I [Aliiglaciecola sp. CAU 1673]|uniref:ATP synthase subunit I n=1 Tax=Aliiglaciecola sp. CAU 1673 TaxID=3032595 RepID=UPI0023DB91C9|nr:ATP synthase subunit I [Aliiglaciecola sp. CAU 1673]MDF2179715.1 ATP synthase subunit I [Aliiglaciecola sp. CAU 1673]
MASSLAATGRNLARKAIAIQCLTACVLGLMVAILMGGESGLSVFVGGVVSILPNTVFALLAFRYAGASHNQQVVRSFSQGSKFKLALTIFLFVAAFQWPELQVLPMFGGFIATTISQWFALIKATH